MAFPAAPIINQTYVAANGTTHKWTGYQWLIINLDTSPLDDVVEYANQAAFPAVGDVGKIYVALDSNGTFRWDSGGGTYVSVGPNSTVTSYADGSVI